jgi:hypothetical protein
MLTVLLSIWIPKLKIEHIIPNLSTYKIQEVCYNIINYKYNKKCEFQLDPEQNKQKDIETIKFKEKSG